MLAKHPGRGWRGGMVAGCTSKAAALDGDEHAVPKRPLWTEMASRANGAQPKRQLKKPCQARRVSDCLVWAEQLGA